MLVACKILTGMSEMLGAEQDCVQRKQWEWETSCGQRRTAGIKRRGAMSLSPGLSTSTLSTLAGIDKDTSHICLHDHYRCAKMSAPNMANFIMKRPWLKRWMIPLAKWYADAAGYRKLGLR